MTTAALDPTRSTPSSVSAPRVRAALQDPPPLRAALIATALGFLALFLLLPLVAVFAQALSAGLNTYWAAIIDPIALAAIRLTLLTARSPCR